MNFRRWFTVLSVLVLFVGLASAQTVQQPALTCQIGQGAVTPLLRAEGYTELVGDIVLTCTGGATLAAGSAIPQANITVSMNAPVTSRLLGSATVGNLSEALLLIDEPGAGAIGVAGPVPGFGPNAAQILCTTPLSGCTGTVGQTTVSGNTYQVPLLSGSTIPTTGLQNAPNVFQGIVNGNQVTFNGVPILPPGTNAVSRVIRITNVRINANYIGVPAANTVLSAIASVSANPSTVLPVGVAQPVVGFVNTSLQTSFRASDGGSTLIPFLQCQSSSVGSGSTLGTGALAGSVRFRELFASAFKTRVAALSNTALVGQGTNITGGVSSQNIPGFLYNSESGLIFPSVTNSGGTFTAGLADFGTRLKAVFVNIPTGISGIYVAVNNTATQPAVVGGTAISGWAQLVTSETATNSTATFGGGFPGVTGGFNGGAVAQLAISNNSATAVWEILNANPTAIDTFDFQVYVTYTANPANNQPAGTGQVQLSYAPTPSSGAFTAAAAGAASSSLPIPRFIDAPSAVDFLRINLCQTVLLWPYVTTLTGFNTGFAIANTSVDPGASVIGVASARAQAGTCALYLYGTAEFGTMPTMPITVPRPGESITTIAGGTTYANDLASIFAQVGGTTGFSLRSGYMFGVCNFQYAHGYAAISDNRAANWVTSYLALIVTPGSLSPIRGLAAEQFVH